MIGTKLLSSMLICQIPAFFGAVFAIPHRAAWYAETNTPFFMPPAWALSSIWVVIYIMMGLSLFFVLVQNHKSKEISHAMPYFIAQFVLNMMVALSLFVAGSLGASLIILILLLVFIALTIYKFSKISEIAELLLVPYLIVIIYEIMINIALIFLN